MKKIINPEIKYFIISFKHTGRKNKYITLWRPNNAGYCYPIELAGQYNGYEDGYHRDVEGENIPAPVDSIPEKFISLDDRGRKCIKNSRASVSFIRSFIPELN